MRTPLTLLTALSLLLTATALAAPAAAIPSPADCYNGIAGSWCEVNLAGCHVEVGTIAGEPYEEVDCSNSPIAPMPACAGSGAEELNCSISFATSFWGDCTLWLGTDASVHCTGWTCLHVGPDCGPPKD